MLADETWILVLYLHELIFYFELLPLQLVGHLEKEMAKVTTIVGSIFLRFLVFFPLFALLYQFLKSSDQNLPCLWERQARYQEKNWSALEDAYLLREKSLRHVALLLFLSSASWL